MPKTRYTHISEGLNSLSRPLFLLQGGLPFPPFTWPVIFIPSLVLRSPQQAFASGAMTLLPGYTQRGRDS
ncbi:MAG: hypothetical protein DMG78_29225 [Acidobacteria bacterium]|nr:MAG: hypothetical protein DMG78_29225 [Acidobacteriota bacterium]